MAIDIYTVQSKKSLPDHDTPVLNHDSAVDIITDAHTIFFLFLWSDFNIEATHEYAFFSICQMFYKESQ